MNNVNGQTKQDKIKNTDHLTKVKGYTRRIRGIGIIVMLKFKALYVGLRDIDFYIKTILIG